MNPPARRRPHAAGAAAAHIAVLLALAACGGNGTSETAQASDSGALNLRCEVTPGAPPDATIYISHRAFGSPVTIDATEAVAFRNIDNTRHTVDEGTGGHRADNDCILVVLGGHENAVVTFIEPGDYQITCTIHGQMQTVVHVR